MVPLRYTYWRRCRDFKRATSSGNVLSKYDEAETCMPRGERLGHIIWAEESAGMSSTGRSVGDPMLSRLSKILSYLAIPMLRSDPTAYRDLGATRNGGDIGKRRSTMIEKA